MTVVIYSQCWFHGAFPAMTKKIVLQFFSQSKSVSQKLLDHNIKEEKNIKTQKKNVPEVWTRPRLKSSSNTEYSDETFFVFFSETMTFYSKDA